MVAPGGTLMVCPSIEREISSIQIRYPKEGIVQARRYPSMPE
jgi:hypothetical protein